MSDETTSPEPQLNCEDSNVTESTTASNITLNSDLTSVPFVSSEEDEGKALALKVEGNTHFKEGNYESSVESYLAALSVCPTADVSTRAILFSNLAAAKHHLEAYDEAINFCNEALDLNENHTKALIRRAQLFRKCDKLDESLADYQKYLKLIPTDRDAKITVHELTREIEQRNEKMKTEMLGKLKDLGNMVLKPFGLSTENFQLVKNAENGNYSVNFTNNK